jgi:hypothetical protein
VEATCRYAIWSSEDISSVGIVRKEMASAEDGPGRSETKRYVFLYMTEPGYRTQKLPEEKDKYGRQHDKLR